MGWRGGGYRIYYEVICVRRLVRGEFGTHDMNTQQ